MDSYRILVLRLHVNLNLAKYPMPLYQPPPQSANHTTNYVVSLHRYMPRAWIRKLYASDGLRPSLMALFSLVIYIASIKALPVGDLP